MPPTTPTTPAVQRGVETSDANALTVRRSAELATSATQARARVEIEAAYTVALNRPRNLDDVRVKLLEACNRPGFAQAALYAKPVAGKKMKGLSIRFAEEAARQMGNIRRTIETIYDDEQTRVLRIAVTDLETNYTASSEVTVEKTVERRNSDGRVVLASRPNTNGETVYIVLATEDELLTKQNNALSKAVRNLLLDLLPGDIMAEARAKIEKVLNGEVAADPAAARKAIADAFHQLGVTPSALAAFLGHPLEQCSPAEIADLRDYYSAVKAGETTWGDIMRNKEEERAAGAAREPAAAKAREVPAASTPAAPAATQPAPAPAAPTAAPPVDEKPATQPPPPAAPTAADLNAAIQAAVKTLGGQQAATPILSPVAEKLGLKKFADARGEQIAAAITAINSAVKAAQEGPKS